MTEVADKPGEEVMNRHPEIFKEKDLPKNVTAMCWGLSVGEGWMKYIDQHCYIIDDICSRSGIKVVAQQVKEKFGGLRFYYDIVFPEDMEDKKINYYTDLIDGVVKSMEYICGNTCESCGEIGTTEGSRGWIKCLCKPCRELS